MGEPPGLAARKWSAWGREARTSRGAGEYGAVGGDGEIGRARLLIIHFRWWHVEA